MESYVNIWRIKNQFEIEMTHRFLLFVLCSICAFYHKPVNSWENVSNYWSYQQFIEITALVVISIILLFKTGRCDYFALIFLSACNVHIRHKPLYPELLLLLVVYQQRCTRYMTFLQFQKFNTNTRICFKKLTIPYTICTTNPILKWYRKMSQDVSKSISCM